MSFIGNLNYVAIAVIGGVQVANGTMSLGDVQAFIQYSRQFTMPITQLRQHHQRVPVGHRLGRAGVRAARRGRGDPGRGEPRGRSADVRGPDRLDERVVPLRARDAAHRRPDLEVAPGATIAIVGPTGAGKTTLVNLLMRFYEIDGGTITVDGIDIRDVTRDDLRRTFGMVLQDTWLFRGTIRENIAYGADGRDARSRSSPPPRPRTSTTSCGRCPTATTRSSTTTRSNLSQGEKQLLTIARAFLADPQILILDEATSSVDTRTEVLIQRAMAQPDAGPHELRHRPSPVDRSATPTRSS